MQGITTQLSLVLKIRDRPDDPAWLRFVEVYSPLIFKHAKHAGLQDADASDFLQDVLHQISISIANFNPELGKFRQWLYGVCRNALCQFYKSQKRQTRGSGDSAVEAILRHLPDDDLLEREWEVEYSRRLFQWASEQVRSRVHESTWQAFWLTAVEGQPPQQVATELNIGVGSVYVARNRVMRKLRQKIEEIDELEWQ
ncbi:MAG: sigma-70 family RNA polymerase sigma factor [Gemmataceae bacterium]